MSNEVPSPFFVPDCSHELQSVSRDVYNERLVHLMAPAVISGLSKHTALKAALHAPQRFRKAMGKSDKFPIIWGSGASMCVTFDKEDFLSLTETNKHKRTKSISESHVIRGQGYVLWSIPDKTGVLRNLKLKALWIPDCKVRLLSSEGLLQQYREEKIKIKSGLLRLSGLDNGRIQIILYSTLNMSKPIRLFQTLFGARRI